ncbi:hypothetical protein BGZ74_002880 [Mortierella antarctica]|nr:hypothetical protein BGZ74_002880 [Mortierella antarctica]
MVKLRVSVGGSYTDLAIVNCNEEFHPIEFDGPEFQGRAMVRIKDFVGITNDGSEPVHDNDYFKGRNRRFSLQVEGRFKQEWDGEQVYFGTDFERSVDLPDGFEMMLKIARYIDPVVRTSLTKDGKPWILSPLVSSINTMAAWKPQDANLPSPPLTPRQSTDMSHGLLNESHSSSSSSSMWGFLGLGKKRNKRSSVMSNSSTDIYGSYNNSPNPSQLNIAGSHSSAFSGDSPNHAHFNVGSRSSTFPSNSSDSPNPSHFAAGSNSSIFNDAGSLGSSTTSSDWATTPNSAAEIADVGTQDEVTAALGHWRQHLDEDTTFFMPHKPSMSTPQRRKHFQSEQRRKKFVFRPELVHGFEFFSPHMDFNTFDIRMGLSMNIRKYLAGQPVRYTCRTLGGETVFWAVQFELVD